MASMSRTFARSATYGPTKSCSRVVAARSAFSKLTRFTSRRPASRIAFARDSTAFVMSPPAGPPSGGLYLKPPSSGGLWDGVTTTPSARSVLRPRFQVRIAWEIAGVGV